MLGSFLPVPALVLFDAQYPAADEQIVPGEHLFPDDKPILLNVGRTVVELEVLNTADRPIQVGSHYHFCETNPYLRFNRRTAYGMHLNM